MSIESNDTTFAGLPPETDTKAEKRSLFYLSLIVLSVFLLALIFVNKIDYTSISGLHLQLTGSTMKFTNNWLSDGVVNDRFVMMDLPKSIETPDIESRRPYVSYPGGVVLVVYSMAQLLGFEQIDIRFVKCVDIFFYALDALLLALLLYLALAYLLEMKSRRGKITLSTLLTTIWILMPNNVYYLRNVFFADQMALFFIHLALVFELLRNYVPIKSTAKKRIINVLYFITLLLGMLTDYYVWVFSAFLIIVNLITLLIEKERFIVCVKKLLFYLIPYLAAVGLYVLELVQVDHWRERLMFRASERSGFHDIGDNYLMHLCGHIYKSYNSIGLMFALLIIAALVYLIYLGFFKKQARIRRLMLFATLLFIPPIVQIFSVLNHSSVHEFSILKLGLPFVFGLLLVIYALFVHFQISIDSFVQLKKCKVSLNRFALLGGALTVCFLSEISVNIPAFYKKREQNIYITTEITTLLAEMNDYRNVFFSFTEWMPYNAPPMLALSKKMIYRIDDFPDINAQFPQLSDSASVHIIINKFAEKTNEIVEKEKQVIENYEFVKESESFAVYKRIDITK